MLNFEKELAKIKSEIPRSEVFIPFKQLKSNGSECPVVGKKYMFMNMAV